MRTAAVTGAFSFTGRAIARRLLERGVAVRTLTNHRPDVGAPPVPAHPLRFDDRAALVESLRGADTLYNTYWVRFPYRGATYEQAVAHSRLLVDAAREAGVARLVHVSIANAFDSDLPYYRGKAEVERHVEASGLAYAILRPTVLFGRVDSRSDILVNNIAWFLRHLPLAAVPGAGDYGIQPVSVDDVADLAVEAGLAEGNLVLDAAGPEVFAFEDFVRLVGAALGRKRPVLHLPPDIFHAVVRAAGPALGDVVLTREEIRGLMAGLLVSREEPRGGVSFSRWLVDAAPGLGRRYASELARHYRRPPRRAVEALAPPA